MEAWDITLNLFHRIVLNTTRQQSYQHHTVKSQILRRVPKILLIAITHIDEAVNGTGVHRLGLAVPAVAAPVLPRRQRPVRAQDDHGRAVARQHGHDACRVLGRLLGDERLRPDQVARGVADCHEAGAGMEESARLLCDLGWVVLGTPTCMRLTSWCVRRRWLAAEICR